MKFFNVFAVAFFMVVCWISQGSAAPAEAASIFDDAANLVNGGGAVSSLGTCDVVSFLGVQHTACAAHCLMLGKEGGYCDKEANCICRDA
ncbi:phormicin-like [Haematobia irritans]